MIYKIKDSVDLYIVGDTLTAYFLNTRTQKNFKVNELTLTMIKALNGEDSTEEISQNLSIPPGDLERLLESLEAHKIIEKRVESNLLDSSILERYSRQLNYFFEYFNTKEELYQRHIKLVGTKFLIFGVGSVGGNIAIQLAMSGAENFVLYDGGKVKESDISRHIYYDPEFVGKSKVEALATELLSINSAINVTCVTESMEPDTDLENLICESDFVINTLDEPYIGYTSAKISRVCTPNLIPHYIAGGFDAHLASTGELIIPGETPCVECYATYFKKALKGWKPSPHPVKNRGQEIGGLASMTLFSSSFASVEIIKHIMEINTEVPTRGELLFNDFSLTFIDLSKDENCAVCGGI